MMTGEELTLIINATSGLTREKENGTSRRGNWMSEDQRSGNGQEGGTWPDSTEVSGAAPRGRACWARKRRAKIAGEGED